MNGVPATIVGVSPRGFVGANVGPIADLTIPVAAFPLVMPEMAALLGPGNFWLRVLARPQSGLSATEAQAQAGDRVAAHRGGAWSRRTGRPTGRRTSWTPSCELSPGGTGWTYLREHLRATAPGAHGRGRPRTAHRLRQRRESAAGPRLGAAERNCRAARHRRQPGPHRPPAARRERAAFLRGRGVRHRARLDDGPFPARQPVDRTDVGRSRSHAELARPGFHGRCRRSTTAILFGLAPALQATALDRPPPR